MAFLVLYVGILLAIYFVELKGRVGIGKVLVRLLPQDEKIDGLYSSRNEMYNKCEVVEIGVRANRLYNWVQMVMFSHPFPFKAGDVVYFPRKTSGIVVLDGVEHMVYDQSEALIKL
jgi:co-chaperonin GroES (HSP10)